MTAPAPVVVAPPGYCCRGWCWLPHDVATERHNLPWDPAAHGPDRPARETVGRPLVHKVDGQWRVTWVTPAPRVDVVESGLFTTTAHLRMSRRADDHPHALRRAVATGHIAANARPAAGEVDATPRLAYQAVRIPAEMATMEDL